MDEFIIYIVIFLIVGGIQIFNAISKGKKGQPNGKGKDFNRRATSQQSSKKPDQREIYKNLGLEELYDQLQSRKQGSKQTEQSSQVTRELTLHQTRMKRQETEASQKEEQSFLDTELDRERASHFSEQNVIREIEKAQKLGKERKHHTHHYLKDSEDAYEADYQKEYELPENVQPKSHPLKKMFQNPKDIRAAIIFNELIDRKY